MRVTFTDPHEDARADILAEAEIVFGDDTPMAGLKLVGFTVWEGEHGIYVTMPGRAFGIGKERGYFDYVRPTHDDRQSDAGRDVRRSALFTFKQWLVVEYERWHEAEMAAADRLEPEKTS